MRVAIPSDDGQALARHTGRCQGFVVAEIADGQLVSREYRPNQFTAHVTLGAARHSHDHGPHGHSHSALVEGLADCQVMVAGGMGQRLHDDLIAGGITAYTTDLATVDEVIAAVIGGALEDVPERRCCHDHGHGHDHDHGHDPEPHGTP